LARRPRFISTQFTRIERGKSVAKPETLAAIREALEKDGVEFTNGKRPGVRLGVKDSSRRLVLKPSRFASSLPKAIYMLGLVDFFVASSHDIFAFSHAALVVGVLVLAAMVGAAKVTTSPSEIIAAMISPSLYATGKPVAPQTYSLVRGDH